MIFKWAASFDLDEDHTASTNIAGRVAAAVVVDHLIKDEALDNAAAGWSDGLTLLNGFSFVTIAFQSFELGFAVDGGFSVIFIRIFQNNHYHFFSSPR